MQIEQAKDIDIIRLDDEVLDRDEIDETFRQFKQIIEESASKKLLLDFSKITFVASPALGILISLNQHCERMNARLRLCNMRPVIYDVFAVTQVTQIFKIDDSEEASLAAFS